MTAWWHGGGGGHPQDRGQLDGVVGTADVRVPSPEEALPSAYISNVCVDVDSRRLGVASMLLDKCFEVAAAWGLEEVACLPLFSMGGTVELNTPGDFNLTTCLSRA